MLYMSDQLVSIISQEAEVFQCSCQSFIKLHHRLEPKVPLGPCTAVVVMSASQGHSHGREGGGEGQQGAEELAHQVHQQGDEVDEPVREVSSGGPVAQTHHHTGYEVPKWQGRIVSDEVCLHVCACIICMLCMCVCVYVVCMYVCVCVCCVCICI